MGLKHNLRPLLELESGSNDPMAFIMTTTFIYLIQSPGHIVRHDGAHAVTVDSFRNYCRMGIRTGHGMDDKTK